MKRAAGGLGKGVGRGVGVGVGVGLEVVAMGKGSVGTGGVWFCWVIMLRGYV